jgi:hypothetical protein
MITPIFTIESGKVSGALVAFNKNKNPEELYASEVVLPFQEKLSVDRLELAVISSLKKVVEELAIKGLSKSKGGVTPSVIIVGSPWYGSENKTITSNEKSPVLIKEALFDKLISQEVEAFEKSRNLGENAVVLEKKVTNITLNGYTTNSPMGKKARDIRFSLYLSLTSSEFKKKVENAIHHSFSKGVLAWHTFPFVLFGGLQLQNSSKDFIVVNADAEVSEVLITRNGTLAESVSFPYGTTTFIRRVGDILHSTFEVNLSLFQQYQDGQLSGPLKAKIDNALSLLQKDWGDAFGKALHEGSQGLSIPAKVFIKSEPQFEKIIKMTVENEEFAQHHLSGQKFQVEVIDSNELHKLFFNSIIHSDKIV